MTYFCQLPFGKYTVVLDKKLPKLHAFGQDRSPNNGSVSIRRFCPLLLQMNRTSLSNGKSVFFFVLVDFEPVETGGLQVTSSTSATVTSTSQTSSSTSSTSLTTSSSTTSVSSTTSLTTSSTTGEMWNPL